MTSGSLLDDESADGSAEGDGEWANRWRSRCEKNHVCAFGYRTWFAIDEIKLYWPEDTGEGGYRTLSQQRLMGKRQTQEA